MKAIADIFIIIYRKLVITGSCIRGDQLWPLKNLFSNFTGLSLILFYIVHIRNLGGNHKEMALKLKDLEETRS